MLKKLEWPTLKQRKIEARLTDLYKAINGILVINIQPYFKQKQHKTKTCRNLKFINASCKSNTIKYSFFPRTISADWIRLLPQMIEASNTEIFKNVLRAHNDLQ